jgi:hypothetical protein
MIFLALGISSGLFNGHPISNSQIHGGAGYRSLNAIPTAMDPCFIFGAVGYEINRVFPVFSNENDCIFGERNDLERV